MTPTELIDLLKRHRDARDWDAMTQRVRELATLVKNRPVSAAEKNLIVTALRAAVAATPSPWQEVLDLAVCTICEQIRVTAA